MDIRDESRGRKRCGFGNCCSCWAIGLGTALDGGGAWIRTAEIASGTEINVVCVGVCTDQLSTRSKGSNSLPETYLTLVSSLVLAFEGS